MEIDVQVPVIHRVFTGPNIRGTGIQAGIMIRSLAHRLLSGKSLSIVATCGFVSLVAIIARILRLAPATVTIRDATTVFAIAGIAAVAIERVIELAWTMVDVTGNAGWPLNVPSKALDERVTRLSNGLTPVYENAKNALDRAQQDGRLTGDLVDRAKQQIDTLSNQLAALTPANSNDRVQLVIRGIADLQETYPPISAVLGAADQALSDASDFVATFKDNPGRRLLSIIGGACLGLAASGFLGLDLFNGMVGQSATGIGIVVTGLVLGLGSNPTHDVIRAIQEFKNSQAAAATK